MRKIYLIFLIPGLSQASPLINQIQQEAKLSSQQECQSSEDFSPLTLQCFMAAKMEKAHKLLDSDKLDFIGGAPLREILGHILSYQTLTSLKESHPLLFVRAHERLQKLAQEGRKQEVQKSLENFIHQEVFPKMVEDPKMQKFSLLFFSALDMGHSQRGAKGAFGSLAGALFSIDSQWMEILASDVEGALTKKEVDELFQWGGICTQKMARSSLVALQQALPLDDSGERTEAQGGPNHLKELVEASIVILDKINSQYTTYAWVEQDDGTMECEKKRNLYSMSWFGGDDSFTSQEKPLINWYFSIVKKFISSNVLFKFELWALSSVLEHLKKGDTTAAASELRNYTPPSGELTPEQESLLKERIEGLATCLLEELKSS